MTVLKKANSILTKFKRDESGTAALTWALSLTVIIGAMGAAMDFAILSNADARSQAIADTTALAGAIYVKTHGRPPTADGELTDGIHTAASLGYKYKNFVVGGAEGVDVIIDYDDNAKEVTTTVVGKTNPTLVQILGFGQLEFSSTSVVSYLNIEDKFPASIALVLDNSGSMQFDDRLPERIENVNFDCWKWNWGWFISTCTHRHGVKADGAQIRLAGLKSSVIKFQDDLRDRLGTEDESDRRTVRMGMLPYSSAIDEDREVAMNWGYLPEGTQTNNNNANAQRTIYGMRADGGTNSNPPMARARTWLQAEGAHHTAEAERTQSIDKEALKFVIFMTDGQNTVGDYDLEEGPTGEWHRENSNGTWTSRSKQFNGSTEGTLTLLTDAQTIDSCTLMKEQEDVTIFTIGYALEDAGEYRVNGWNNNHDDELFNVEESVRSAAYNLMQSCASSPEHFIPAANADQLERAFDEIQNAIVEELIRVKS